MKKILLILLGSMMVFSLFLFTACDNPIEKDPEDNQTKVAYSVPTIEAGAEGLTVIHDTATAFKVKEDNGEWTDGAFIAFSETLGAHTVKAYAVGSGDKLDSEEVSFSYETKAAAVTVEKGEGRSFTVEFTGLKLQSVNEGVFEDTTDTEYAGVPEGEYVFKAIGGYDAQNNVFYAGEDTESISVLSAPTIEAGAEGFTAIHDTATAFKVKEDDGEWTDGAFIAFNETLGAHIVKAYAVGGDGEIDSEEVSFAYETKAAEVTITKGEGRSFTVEFTGIKLQKSVNGGDFEDTAVTEYADLPAGEYAVKAVGGWDGESDIFYAGESVQSIKLVAPAEQALVIEDAENTTTGELQEIWDIKKYGSTWEATSASISLGETYTGSPCVIFNCWNNYTKFRYSKTYRADAGYNVLSFDVQGDGIASMELSIKDSNSGIYLNAKMGTLENGWAHYEVSLYDEAWKIYYNGTPYDVDLALGQVGASVGVTSKDEIVAFCDTFSIILSGATPNGANTKIYFDNIAFEYKDNPETQIIKQEIDPANLILDFGTYTSGVDFNDEQWTRYVDNNPTSGQMRIRQGDRAEDNAVVNMYADGNTRKYAYGINGVLGKANYFSVRLGNYFSGREIKYKIAIVDISGAITYLAGAEGDNFEILSPEGSNSSYSTRTFVKKEYVFAEEIAVKYFYFVIKTASGDAYLYIDDVRLLAEIPDDYVEPSNIDLSQYSSVNETEDFSTYEVKQGSGLNTLHGNLAYSWSGKCYIRNDVGGGSGDNKYASAQYANNGAYGTVGTQTTMTYTLGTQGIADGFSFAVANDRNANAKAVTVTVKVYDVNDELVEITGDDTFDVAAGAAWADKAVTFTRTAVKKVELIIELQEKATGDAYIKIDNLAFTDSEA